MNHEKIKQYLRKDLKEAIKLQVKIQFGKVKINE